MYFSAVDKCLKTDLKDTALESAENWRKATNDSLKSGEVLYLVAAMVRRRKDSQIYPVIYNRDRFS